MPKLNGKVPSYRLHKVSGQGIVTLNGKDHYCGPYAEPESRAEYDRLIAVWLAGGRQMEGDQADRAPITINELIVRFWTHAESYYRLPDGTLSREVEMYRLAVRPLVHLFGETSCSEFGPLRLKTVRNHMVGLNWCRNHINHQISRLKSIFRWGTEEELVPGSVYHALLSLKGLRRGRGEAIESEPVRPVPEEYVCAVKDHVSKQVWALIQLQLFTGARPGELVGLRPIDIDTTGEVWAAKLDEHKTAHHGHERVVYFGPQAKKVLLQFIENRPTHAYLFSAAEAKADRRAKRTKRRKTPLSCGNRLGTNQKVDPRRMAGECYDVAAYRRAIARGCDLAFPPPQEIARIKVEAKKGYRWEKPAEWKARLGPEGWSKLQQWLDDHRWHPHQLRHNAATRVRKERGIDAARALLGHRSLAITDIYAELDQGLAASVVRAIG